MTQLADLRSEVNNLAEAFSEVEDGLDSNVYNMFAKPLGKIVENLESATAQTENLNTAMRIIALITKFPHVKLSSDRLDQWEVLCEGGHPHTRTRPLEVFPELPEDAGIPEVREVPRAARANETRAARPAPARVDFDEWHRALAATPSFFGAAPRASTVGIELMNNHITRGAQETEEDV